MKDLQGQPYDQLKTAFLYRTEYLLDCKCQPHPWETEATERHRTYAMATTVGHGNNSGEVAGPKPAMELRVLRDVEAVQFLLWKILPSQSALSEPRSSVLRPNSSCAAVGRCRSCLARSPSPFTPDWLGVSRGTNTKMNSRVDQAKA